MKKIITALLFCVTVYGLLLTGCDSSSTKTDGTDKDQKQPPAAVIAHEQQRAKDMAAQAKARAGKQ